MGEQLAKGKNQGLGEVIDRLSEISRKIDGDTEGKKPKLVFNDNVEKDVKTDLVEKNGEEAKPNPEKEDGEETKPNPEKKDGEEAKPESGEQDGKNDKPDSMEEDEEDDEPEADRGDCLSVKVYEDIDIKDVSKGSKFTIRILNRDGFYVDIDMFAYRDIVLDNEKSEEEFITSKVERIIGINSDIDRASKAICDILSKLCYQKDLQIKRYRELGWDFYSGVQIFKYDKIYCVANEIDMFHGECANEVAAGLRNAEDTAVDYEDWLVDFSRLIHYSDTDALIIATACTGVIRQLLPYTKENNINMNIVGKRASGKSIISHFALSMFGDPGMLEGSFTDTDNAMEIARSERLVLPYILDERMLKIEGKSENSKRHALLMDIFREYEGKVKERLAGQGSELSGKRTYGPVISSSVEPMLDKLLEESRDLGQYRRFIELRIEPEDLFYDSRMAETTEEVAYTHYGHGILMLINYLAGELTKDKEFVTDMYTEINSIISAILHVVEKKKNLEGMLRSCSKRFALIITTLEILLRAAIEESVSGMEVEADYGWIGNNLDKADFKKIEERLGKGGGSKKGNSYLEKSVNSYLNGGKVPFHTKSENVLGILIDNAVEKMSRLSADSDIDIYADIIDFIKGHRGVFFTENKKWNGKGGYIGKLEETEKQYIIHIRVNKLVEWVLVHGGKLKDDELTVCIERLESAKNRNEAKEILQEIFGNVLLGDFESLILKKYEDRIIWKKGEGSRGANNVTLAEIVLEKDIVDSKGMKDSDKKEDKENEA